MTGYLSVPRRGGGVASACGGAVEPEGRGVGGRRRGGPRRKRSSEGLSV